MGEILKAGAACFATAFCIVAGFYAAGRAVAAIEKQWPTNPKAAADALGITIDPTGVTRHGNKGPRPVDAGQPA